MAILAGVLALTSVWAQKSTGPIPGIDVVPDAVDPSPRPLPVRKEHMKGGKTPPVKKEPVKKEPVKKEPVKKEPVKKDPTKKEPVKKEPVKKVDKSNEPVIRDIKIQPHPEFKDSALITWKFNKENTTEIYVGRYHKPVMSRDLVLDADNLTAPPLGPAETSMSDRNIPPGTYYYVVVTRGELSRRGKLIMKPNFNYTVIPFIAKDSEPVKKVVKVKPFPVIKELKVRRHPSLPTAALLTWDFEKNSSEIFIARSTTPITKTAQLSEIKMLTKEPLNAWEKYYIDRDIPNGTYYYVVYTAIEVGDKLKLEKGNNVSSEPLLIDFKKKEPVKKEPVVDAKAYAIKGLLAVNSRNSVKLNWEPAAANNIFYKIYRGTLPLDSEIGFKSAKLLGRVAENTLIYQDNQPLVNKDAYYGIVAADKKTGKEFRKLIFGASFIKHKFEKRIVKAAIEDFLPDALTPFQRDSNTVTLYWAEPDKKIKGYRIYRHFQPLDRREKLANATAMGQLGGDATSFTDRRLKPGRYYYAILPLDSNGREMDAFQEGRTFTGFPVVIETPLKKEPVKKEPVKKEPVKKEPVKKIPEPRMKSLKTEIRGEKDVLLSWEVLDRERKDFKFFIYRSKDPLKNIQDVRDFGKKIQELNFDRRRYLDKAPGFAKHYYALVLSVKGKLQETMVEGRNYPAEAVIIAKKKEPVKKEPVKKEPVKKEPVKKEPELPEFKSLTAKKVGRDIALTWEIDLKGRKDVRIRMYRSNRPMRNFRELRDFGFIINELSGNDVGYVDRDMPDGTYYYALLLEVNKKIQRRMIEGRNFLKRPLVYKTPVKKEPVKKEPVKKEPIKKEPVKKEPVKKEPVRKDPVKIIRKDPRPVVKPAYTRADNRSEKEMQDAISRILLRTYKKRRFSRAVSELAPYVYNGRLPGAVRGRAMFYTGLCFYRMKRYNSAVEYFLNFRVQNQYPRRSRFWYRRSLERIR